jgi:hypothetical protein
MKTRFALTACLALVCASAWADTPTNRVWRDTKGRKVQATFVRIEGETIVLQTVGGQLAQFPLASLSEYDQTIAKNLKPYDPPATGAQIDALVDKVLVKQGVKPNAPSSDEQFLRRAYLSIVGRVPNYDEAKEFLENGAPNKRDKLIDQLLDSPGYTSHLFNYLADMLRVLDEGRNATQSALPYVNWLKQQVDANKPYDEMVREMLTATGTVWEAPATGYLLRDTGMQLDNLANTFAIFLGTDVACAQCHDHPFSDRTQMQFYQLASFFGATMTNLNNQSFKNGDPTERLMTGLGQLSAKSGVTLDKKKSDDLERAVRDIVAANRERVADTKENRLRLPQDYKYDDAKGGEPVEPKFIRWDGEKKGNVSYKQNLKKEENLRQSFAQWMTHKDHPRFAMTIANRLWKRAFGQGIMEPVTKLDDPMASANPELLMHLTQQMVKLKFNLRDFQRMIYKSAAWQRSATTADIPMGSAYYFQGPILRRMSAEQAWDSYMTLVLGQPDGYRGKDGGRMARTFAIDDLDKVTAEVMASKLAAYQRIRGGDEMLMTGGSLADAGATGMEEAGSKKVISYGGMNLLRAAELQQPEQPGHFLREFGQSARISFDGSSTMGSQPQLLMLMNGPVQEMLTDAKSLVFRNMATQSSVEGKIDALFLTLLARKPNGEEKQAALEAVAADPESTYANLIWALSNGLEFLFVQ